MKNGLFLILLFSLLILIACGGQGSEPSTSTKSHKGSNLRTAADYNKIEPRAEFVLSYILDSCQHLSAFEVQSDGYIKVTPKMHQLIKFGNWDKTCEHIKTHLPSPIDRQLVEAFYSIDRLTKVFRYKILHNNYPTALELRLIFTDQNKLTEFRFYEWGDTYSPDLIKMPWF